MMRRLDECWFLTSELEGERASSFRQERWCNIFLEAGARLRIFNLRGAFDCSDVVCEDAEAVASFRRRGLAHQRKLQASVREGRVAQGLRRIKHLLMVDLYLPNVVRLFFHLRGLLARRDERVVVMASSPPFSLAVVGALVKRLYPEKVVLAVDMRDAWALHNALGGIKPLKRLIESSALRTADSVSTVSTGLADEFKRHYRIDVGVMYNVATHYLDAPRPDPISLNEFDRRIDPSRIVLAYTGSTPEHHYDLASIVGGLALLIRRAPDVARRLQLVFVGACDEVRREAVAQGVGEPHVVFVPHVPHAQARAVQMAAAGSIFLAHSGPNNMGVVSTKLFEYLCLGQFVLPFDLCVGSDVDLLLRRYCGSSINAHGRESIAALLERVGVEGVSFLPRLQDAERVRELVTDYRCHAQGLLGN